MPRIAPPRLLSATLVPMLLALAAPAFAAVIPLSIEDLVRKSDTVVRAHVVATESAYGEWIHGGEVIYTTATLEITETLRGVPARTATVTCIGGTVDGITMNASHAPMLHTNEDVVLFLLEYEGKQWITGLENGLYRIEAGDTAVNPGDATARRVPLDDLRAEIRDAIRRVDR